MDFSMKNEGKNTSVNTLAESGTHKNHQSLWYREKEWSFQTTHR